MKQKKSVPSVESVVKEIQSLAKALGHPPDKADFMKATGTEEWQIRKLFGGWSKAVEQAGFSPMLVKMAQMEKEIRRLNSALDEANEHAVTSTVLQQLIHGANDHGFGEVAPWLAGPRKRTKATAGTPTLFLSDIHFDEVVKPEQVDFVNEFNHEIAVKRIKHCFSRAITLLKDHFSLPRYDGMVVALGGDMLSGNIHEELAETNEQRILSSVLDLTDLLITGIGMCADEFGKVFVPCVVGNHGRLHKKPRAKGRVRDNFEWLIYQYIAKYFASDDRVTVMIPDSADAQFSIYDLNMLLTHGDQFKGGGGVSGVFAPLMTGMARKQKRQQSVKRPFDIMMMGHWHQYIHTESLLINGSVKGYDEFAYLMNFAYERPQQALFVAHPDKGCTFRMPVICEPSLSRA